MSAQTSQGVAARTVAMEAAPDRKKPGLLDRIADHFRRYWQRGVPTPPPPNPPQPHSQISTSSSIRHSFVA